MKFVDYDRGGRPRISGETFDANPGLLGLMRVLEELDVCTDVDLLVLLREDVLQAEHTKRVQRAWDEARTRVLPTRHLFLLQGGQE